MVQTAATGAARKWGCAERRNRDRVIDSDSSWTWDMEVAEASRATPWFPAPKDRSMVELCGQLGDARKGSGLERKRTYFI